MAVRSRGGSRTERPDRARLRRLVRARPRERGGARARGRERGDARPPPRPARARGGAHRRTRRTRRRHLRGRPRARGRGDRRGVRRRRHPRLERRRPAARESGRASRRSRSGRRSSCCSCPRSGSSDCASPTSSAVAAGRIVGITSLAAKEPTAHLALSNAIRPGLTGWLKTLANELGPQGITVNCVAPGRIATARLEELYPQGPTEAALAEIPLGRWGTPEEFGDVVCFLASDRARYVTGQTLVVDGGLQRLLF